ncbi:methionyl-tRNA formyltransferase [Ammoniphilus sp. CFH 90114]|uniref:methionyl-tRNA formyltransferase n=1 Tax=Ammoniphilus sp. CFH 90114 TaxID=2493665 RepID=UPI00100EE314|nr:methionyl-tRNA formyltransferase [Ammoniphilus sp. CFH 90114]RXT15047.1 methionyl-tRNA formyltransferase [Ammoniphilus sp. CFH 90114]
MNIIFMGTPDFAVPCLEKLVQAGYQVIEVVTQPDRPKGRKKELTPPPVKEAALKLNIPVFQPEKLKETEAVQHIVSLKPDLIVTAAYGQILPKVIIDLPKWGCINVHASLLPKYRGGAPIHKAIVDGEIESGVTIMYMVEKLDAGDILTQVKVPIEQADNVGTLHDKLSSAGSDLLLDTIPLLQEGKIIPRKQEEELVTYAWNIRREDEKIDWNKPAREIYNQIRGLNPWPVAYTQLEEQVFKIWWAEVIDEQSENISPGTIVSWEAEGIDVACGRGILRLKDVQPSGKRKMSVSDYVRGMGKHYQPEMKFC